MRRQPALTIALAACALAAAGRARCVIAEDVLGPPIREGSYQAEIVPGVEGPDEDVYRGRLALGERLTVKVASVGASGLVPSLTIEGPDGVLRPVTPKQLRFGRALSISGFVVDQTGIWAVRVAGRLATRGKYALSFHVTKAPDVTLAIPSSGDGDASLSFDALEGSRVTVEVTARRAAPAIVDLFDPSGRSVATATGVAKERRALLTVEQLGEGDGRYVAQIDASPDHGGFTARAKVRRPALPKGRRKLTPEEPYIDPRSYTLEGVHELPVRIYGRHFSTRTLPTVLFGDVPGTDLLIDAYGTQIDVTPPVGVAGSTVRVAVVNSDGQVAERSDYFFYVPAPTLTSVTDRDGARVLGGSTTGGRVVRLHGTNFRSGLAAKFGGVTVYPQLFSPEEAECTSPPHAAGDVVVGIEDAYLHVSEVEELFTYKVAPTFASPAYTPSVVAAEFATPLELRGFGFQFTDEVLVNGEPVPSVWISTTKFSATVPAGADGLLRVEVRDRVGTVVRFPDLHRKTAPVITGVTASSGAYVGTRGVAIAGGSVVTISGSGFDPTDVVTAGTAVGTQGSRTLTSFDFIVPASPTGLPGDQSITVTDQLGRSATALNAVRFMGYVDDTAVVAPAVSATDDFSALRAVTGDFDGDTQTDDFAIVSHTSSPGTRTVRTRVLRGNVSHVLGDVTATDFPVKGKDASGLDDWSGRPVVAFDLNAASGIDLLVGGPSPANKTQGDVRAFLNSGTGVFAYDASRSTKTTYRAKVEARDETNALHTVTGVRAVLGSPQAMVLADVSGDQRLDLIVARDREESSFLGVDSAYVDFTTTPPSITAANAAAHRFDVTSYFPALQIFTNDLAAGNGWVDSSASRLPSVGDSTNSTLPAFPARDVAVADLNGDSYPDLVVTWDDPTTTTPSGLGMGTRFDAARIATRVLINDGTGVFVDRTSTWMPAAAAPEFWQANRLALRDLDGDGKPDLVLVHGDGLDAYLGIPLHKRSALRVLRNTGSAFTDVTATAIPVVSSVTTDDYRGSALVVGDVDGDGIPDLLVGTPGVIRTPAGVRLRSTRLFLGNAKGPAFRDGTDFLPAATSDGGEAEDLLLTPLLATTDPTLVLVTEGKPQASAGGRYLRVFEWKR